MQVGPWNSEHTKNTPISFGNQSLRLGPEVSD